MPDNLFFIRILADAFRHPDLDAGMRKAVAIILERRDDPQYRRAFQQFLRLLEAAASDVGDFEQEEITKVAVRMLLGRILQDAPEPQPSPGDTPERDGPHASCATAIRAMQELAARPAPITLQVQRDRELLASFSLPLAGPTVIRRIRPGSYTFAMDTGRLLWSGVLGPADLLWQYAFPGQPLGVAAESSVPSVTPTRRITLAVGALTIVVYPGVETGSIQMVTGEPIT